MTKSENQEYKELIEKNIHHYTSMTTVEKERLNDLYSKKKKEQLQRMKNRDEINSLLVLVNVNRGDKPRVELHITVDGYMLVSKFEERYEYLCVGFTNRECLYFLKGLTYFSKI